MSHVRRSAVVIATLAAALLLPASASAAPSPAAAPILDVSYGDCEADVEQLAPNTKITATLRSKSGALKGRDSDTADGGGDADLCFPAAILGGDTITVRQGDTVLRRLTIPTLGIRPDRDTDVVTVRGKPGITINVVREDCGVAGSGCPDYQTLELTVPPSGTYEWDLEGIQDITGGDRFWVEWTSPKGDWVGIYTNAPNLLVFMGRSRVTGAANPGTAVTVRIRREGVLIGQGSATADTKYDYAATLRKNGTPVPVLQGDVVRGDFASDAVLTANLTIGISGDDITGECAKDQDVRLTLKAPGTESYWYGTTNEFGVYRFSNVSLDERVGQTAIVLCTTQAGDTLGARLVVPAP